MNEQRRLAAILVADVVGYSKLIGSDEGETLAQLRLLRSEIIEPQLAKHSGRLFKSVGDGFLIEFASAVQAVTAAQAVQQANANGPLPLRIGIHVGDVVVQGDDLMGDAVNIAARLEGVADAGGIAISRQVRDQVRDKLDIGLVDKGAVELKNIARPVRVFTVTGARMPALPEILALPDKPSIAVLPFLNMSGDPEQEYFADGISEDIITELTRFRSLFVIARNSSFSYKGKSPDIRDVGRELGVRYVLEGSVRKASDRVRLTAQLIDAQTGNHIWAERYDRKLDDVFAVQEELTRGIVVAIAPNISASELGRTRPQRTGNLGGYDLAVRAHGTAWNALVRSDPKMCDEALRLVAAALTIDPDNIMALEARAMAHFQYVARGAARDRETSWSKGLAAAEQMLEIDRLFSNAHAWKGWFLAYAPGGGRLDDALASARHGHDLNPHDMTSLICLAFLENMAGNPERSIELVQEALRISPRDPLRPHLRQQLAMATFQAGRYAESIGHAREAIAEAPRLPPPHAFLAASYAALGQLGEAKAAFAAAVKAGPEYVERMLSGPTIGRGRRLRDFLRIAAGLDEHVAATPDAASLALADKPSIAVLPFQNMSGDPEQEYFADGIVEELITALSRFKSLFVIARNSTFFYKGKSPDVRQVGRELGVRYVLEGSVRKAGNRVRITGQLIEAANNAHLWADRFEGTIDDIFTLQDKVTSSVVGIVEPTIQLSEIQRAQVKPTTNLTAYDCYLRGVPKYNRWTREANQDAHRLFSAALELDPHYAAALIRLAYVHAQRWMQGWTEDRQREVEIGKRLQEQALELAKDDQFVLASSAYLHIQFGGDVATAVSLIERAMVLNPNSSVTLECSTWVRIRSGDPELAIEHCLRAMQLNPHTQTNTPLAIAYFLLGREQEAMACIDEALINAPRALPTLRFAALIKVGFGRVEEARQLVKRILEVNPNSKFSPGGIWTTSDKPEYKRKWIEAFTSLAQLGLPE